MLERLFRLRENGTTLRTEIVAGVTTFLTMSYITPSMKHAITAGIGLFIAFIGLQNAGLIVKDPGTAVRLNPQFASPDLLGYFVFVRSRL